MNESEKSECSQSEATNGDAPVSQSQLNTVLNQFAQMQRQTMQEVHQMQTSLREVLSSNQSHAQPTSAASSAPPSNPSLVPLTARIPGYIKLAKPSLFTGAAKANVETWLFEVEQYLMAYEVDDDSQRIAFAAASLKGLALQWWQNHCILHPSQRLSWQQFKEEVKKRFQPVEASRTARVNLRSLKQGNKSVAEYCSAFYEQLQLIHDMSEADQVENFMAGLNWSTSTEVDRRDPLTLQDAMMLAQRTEIRGRFRTTQRGTSSDSYKYNRFYNHYRPNSNGQEKTTTTHENRNTGPTPMELGRVGTEEEEEVDEEELEKEWKDYLDELEQEEPENLNDEDNEEGKANNEEQEDNIPQLHAITNRRPIPKEEFFRLRKEGKCFRCKQPGHFSRECPNIRRFQNPRRNGGRQPNPSKY